jgi:hypothetical protein
MIIAVLLVFARVASASGRMFTALALVTMQGQRLAANFLPAV